MRLLGVRLKIRQLMMSVAIFAVVLGMIIKALKCYEQYEFYAKYRLGYIELDHTARVDHTGRGKEDGVDRRVPVESTQPRP
jgi:hypothetical protein